MVLLRVNLFSADSVCRASTLYGKRFAHRVLTAIVFGIAELSCYNSLINHRHCMSDRRSLPLPKYPRHCPFFH